MHSRPDDAGSQHHDLLVVDDEQSILALIGEALAEEELRVTLAPDLPGALRALDRDRFDLVLADPLAELNAGRALDPWPALEAIQAHAGDTRVVIFSAHPARYFADWHARGFGGFIAKPFDLDELIETVHIYLSASRDSLPQRGPTLASS